MKIKSIIPFAILIATTQALALPSPLQMKPTRLASPIQAGAIAGGQASDAFTLLGIRNEKSNKSEKLVLMYGDRIGRPLKGEPGYFHVALDRDSKRIVIDLAQLHRTAIDGKELARIIASSKYVSSSDMTMDPHDGSTNITLTLRSPVELVVDSKKSGQGAVVIEMRPIEAR